MSGFDSIIELHVPIKEQLHVPSAGNQLFCQGVDFQYKINHQVLQNCRPSGFPDTVGELTTLLQTLSPERPEGLGAPIHRPTSVVALTQPNLIIIFRRLCFELINLSAITLKIYLIFDLILVLTV